MWTEDAIRRRELAVQGIKAEVESDGYQVRVTMDRLLFDRLSFADRNVQLASYAEGHEDGKAEGFEEGWAEGVDDGRRALLKELEKLKETP